MDFLVLAAEAADKTPWYVIEVFHHKIPLYSIPWLLVGLGALIKAIALMLEDVKFIFWWGP